MNKEIICLNKECKQNEYNHCKLKVDFITLDINGKCCQFQIDKHFDKKIEELTSKKTYTKSDLIDIEQNKAKYGTKNER